MELKHNGLDNEDFGNEGWVDSYLGIFSLRGLVEGLEGFPWTTHYSVDDCDGFCSVRDYFFGKRW